MGSGTVEACLPLYILLTVLSRSSNLARVDSSSPLCWSQAQEKREGWKPHFCKTTHTQNPQRNTTHRHQPRNSEVFPRPDPVIDCLGGSHE
nr:unnamed protein product [Callosobruchus chinensis]